MAKTHLPVDAEHVMRELSRADMHLAGVICQIGSFPNKKQKSQQPFASLLQAIVYQQLAGKAAATIFGRVKTLSQSSFPTPEEILLLDETKLRGTGLSRQKSPRSRTSLPIRLNLERGTKLEHLDSSPVTARLS